MPATKNFRKRTFDPDDSEDEAERRLALEEVKLLQKQRERKLGIPALLSSSSSSSSSAAAVAADLLYLPSAASAAASTADAGKEDLVLQDTFAQETAVTVEDPNMLKYVEQELAKRRGKKIDAGDREEKDALDELYAVPEHLKVKKRNSEESSTQWTTGIAEVQLPIEFADAVRLRNFVDVCGGSEGLCVTIARYSDNIEYKLKNIEETEAAKKLLQEKRLVGKTKSELSIPSSYSADYLQRGRDYAEKLRREHPELHKDRGPQVNEAVGKSKETNNPDGAVRRQAATDEFMLERFRKRERHRVMRR